MPGFAASLGDASVAAARGRKGDSLSSNREDQVDQVDEDERWCAMRLQWGISHLTLHTEHTRGLCDG